MRYLIFFIAALSFGQQVIRVDPNPAVTTAGNVSPTGYPALYALQGANINLYTDAAATIYATTYTDATGSQACPAYAQVVEPGAICVSTSGTTGNFGWWITPGSYFYTITSQGTVYGPFPIDTNIIVNAGQYNQGSTNAVTQTVTGKLQQYLSLDDFGALPGGTASTNTNAIQNAINYAAPLGIILSCQGNYPINNTLTIVNGLKIFGHGEGTSVSSTNGCTIQQTNAAVPMWKVLGNGVIVGFHFQDMQFSGGTYGIDMEGASNAVPSGAGDVKLIRTHWSQTLANLHMNPYALIQDLYTEYNFFNGGGSGTNCWEQLNTAGANNGFLVTWESHRDNWAFCDNAWNFDSSGHSIAWDIFSPRFQQIHKTMVVLAGSITVVNIQDGSAEQVNLDDPTPVRSTCTASASSTTLTCASSGFQNGQILTVQAAALNGTFGGTNPGWDEQVTVVSGGGTTSLTVTPAIALAVTNTPTTNQQYDFWDFIKSPVNGISPSNITIKNSLPGGDRYFISSTNSTMTLVGQQPGSVIYDPNGSIVPIGSGVVNGSGAATNWRTAFPYTLATVLPSNFRPFSADPLFPSVYAGNPISGTLFTACANNQINFCGTTGTWGPWNFQGNGQGRSMLYMDPNTFTTWFGKSGPASGTSTNVIIGSASAAPTGANNTLTLFTGTCPATTSVNSVTLCEPSSGILTAVTPSGQTQLVPPTVTPIACTVDLLNQAAYQNNVQICSAGSVGAGPVMVQVTVYAKVTQAATVSSILGTGTVTGAIARFLDGTDFTVSQVTLPCATEAGTIANGNAGNVLTSTMQCTGNVWVKTNTNVGIYFGYTSSGATPMQYEFHARAVVTDNIPTS